MFETYLGLHDLDLTVAVCKVGEQTGEEIIVECAVKPHRQSAVGYRAAGEGV